MKYASAAPSAMTTKQIGIARDNMLDVFIITGSCDPDEEKREEIIKACLISQMLKTSHLKSVCSKFRSVDFGILHS